jgi:hypothetical protein
MFPVLLPVLPIVDEPPGYVEPGFAELFAPLPIMDVAPDGFPMVPGCVVVAPVALEVSVPGGVSFAALD